MRKRICCCIFGVMLTIPNLLLAQVNVQIIHNMPDLALDSVSVFIDNLAVEANLKYLDATAFAPQPVGAHSIAIGPGNNISPTNVFATFPVTFDAQGGSYVLILNGVKDPNLFAPNPGGLGTGISIAVKSGALELAGDSLSVQFLVAQGVPDAPSVDVISPTIAQPLADNATFGAISGYTSVPPAQYTVNVTSATNNADILQQFTLDFTAKAGSTAVVFTTGFLHPANNQDGVPLGLYAAYADGDVIEMQRSGQAFLQVIHNVADSTLGTVDIYVNNDRFADNIGFRSATPFLERLAVNNLTLGVADSTSLSAAEAFATFNLTVTPGDTAVALLKGVRDTTAFAPNPGGLPTNLSVSLKTGARRVASNSTSVEFFVANGVTDAPVIDVGSPTITGPIADNLAYGGVGNYLSVPPATYTVNLTPGDNTTPILDQFTVALDTLANRSLVLFTSGFLSPLNNQQGDSLALLGALADGTVIGFPHSGRAKVQIIHTSADTTLKTVDIYFNKDLFLPDFQFLDASPFMDVLALNSNTLGIAPATSVSVSDTIKSFNLTLVPNDRYVGFLSGVRDPNLYAKNPDSLSTGLAFFLKNGVRSTSTDTVNLEFFVAQNATDTPTIDILADSVATPLANDIRYGGFTDYVSIPPANYRVDLTAANDTLNVLAKFDNDLTTVMKGTPLVLFTGGFLNPAGNLNGEQLGLFLALPTGDLIEFNRFGQAGLQIINNASDPAIASLDIYLNNRLIANDLGFRTATKFLGVIADTLSVLSVAPSTSLSAAEAILTTPIPMFEDSLYIAVTNGLLTPGNFAPNPDSVNTALSVFIKSNGIREEAQDTTNASVDMFMIQGIPDLPTSDFVTTNQGVIFDNAVYGQVNDYVSVPAVDYLIFLTGKDNVADPLARFRLDLSELEGDAVIVLASGFINPSLNQNGPFAGMIAVDSQGKPWVFDVIPSVQGTGIVPLKFALQQNYPNPFNPSTAIRFSLPTSERVSLKIFDIQGRLVAVLADKKMPAGEHTINFDGRGLASGRYFYRLVSGKNSAVHGMTLIK